MVYNPMVHKSDGAHLKCSSLCTLAKCTAKGHYPMVNISNGEYIQW